MDVLVRGCIVVQVLGAPQQGAQAYLDASTGRVTSSAGSNPVNLTLTGCRFRKEVTSGGTAELVLTARTTI